MPASALVLQWVLAMQWASVLASLLASVLLSVLASLSASGSAVVLVWGLGLGWALASASQSFVRNISRRYSKGWLDQNSARRPRRSFRCPSKLPRESSVLAERLSCWLRSNCW